MLLHTLLDIDIYCMMYIYNICHVVSFQYKVGSLLYFSLDINLLWREKLLIAIIVITAVRNVYVRMMLYINPKRMDIKTALKAWLIIYSWLIKLLFHWNENSFFRYYKIKPCDTSCQIWLRNRKGGSFQAKIWNPIIAVIQGKSRKSCVLFSVLTPWIIQILTVSNTEKIWC